MSRGRIKLHALWIGPMVGIVVAVMCITAGLTVPAALTAAITALTAVWWVLEPIPIPATSLIPLGAFPVFGILTTQQVAAAYGHRLILLLMGGFMLSMAMEKSGAHRRLALGMVRAVGGRGGRRVVLGFMLASAALSMWISNTATTLMLLPVALAVLQQSRDPRLAVPLLLGVAYAANVGGIGTPVGTPPNLIFMQHYKTATGVEWTFLDWMKIGVPVVAVFVPLIWLWLTRGLGGAEQLNIPHAGKWRTEERRVLIVFFVTALLWVTRSEPAGGWSALLDGIEGFTTLAHDSSVAMLAVVAMFLIPSGDGRGGRLLDWPTANRIPWGLLILFGGGIAIGTAFGESGLSDTLGEHLQGLSALPTLVMIGAICLTVTFLTEVTSNTATTNILMPILGATASAGFEPALLMLPAAISASCAFMLPVATAPNAIVFGTEQITAMRMVREGVVLNLIGAGVISLICFVLVK